MKKILILCAMLLSCGNEAKIKQDLNLLCTNPIIILDKINVTYNGADTVINDMFYSKLKLVVYTDSTGCTSCGINKMFMWEPYIEYAKQYHGRLKYYFIFHPTDDSMMKLRNTMTLNQINYPMLIDKNGDFERLNPHLPKNKAMHTFLLDENNKVILVGNPLHNKEIEKLFYKKTQELLSK